MPQPEMKEVENFLVTNPVDQVSDGPPEDASERERGQSVPRGELVEEGQYDSNRDRRNSEEETDPKFRGPAGAKTKRGAGISHVGEVEKPVDDRALVSEVQIRLYQVFRELICAHTDHEHEESDFVLGRHDARQAIDTATASLAQLARRQLAVAPDRRGELRRTFEFQRAAAPRRLERRTPKPEQVRLDPGGEGPLGAQ